MFLSTLKSLLTKPKAFFEKMGVSNYAFNHWEEVEAVRNSISEGRFVVIPLELEVINQYLSPVNFEHKLIALLSKFFPITGEPSTFLNLEMFFEQFKTVKGQMMIILMDQLELLVSHINQSFDREFYQDVLIRLWGFLTNCKCIYSVVVACCSSLAEVCKFPLHKTFNSSKCFGFTDQEIKTNFQELVALFENNDLGRLYDFYDGYKFDGIKENAVFSPYSIVQHFLINLSILRDLKVGEVFNPLYSSTLFITVPRGLIKLIEDGKFKLTSLTSIMEMFFKDEFKILSKDLSNSQMSITDEMDEHDLIKMLFKYRMIVARTEIGEVTETVLSFPNEASKTVFHNEIAKAISIRLMTSNTKECYTLALQALKSKQMKEFLKRMIECTRLMFGAKIDEIVKGEDVIRYMTVYLLEKLNRLSQRTKIEIIKDNTVVNSRNSNRPDIILKVDDWNVMIIELKFNKKDQPKQTAKDGIDQIYDRKYYQTPEIFQNLPKTNLYGVLFERFELIEVAHEKFNFNRARLTEPRGSKGKSSMLNKK